MTPEQIAAHLNDPFGKLVLQRGSLPLTLRTLLSVLDGSNQEPEGVPHQRNFLVADGGQIPWSQETEDLNRVFRMVIVRLRQAEAELLISTGTDCDSPTIFLQLFAWDPQTKAFNFYERRSGAWCWAGTSWDALEPDTRGNGPFDSHVNGGPVMKELKAPWINWHSMAATIRDDVLAPGDPLRSEALYRDRVGGEQLEPLIRSGTVRWTKARFDRRLSRGTLLIRAPEFVRHILATTTVNLATSTQESRGLQEGDALRLPRTFFLNTDALLSILQVAVDFPTPKVNAGHYLDCLQRYDVALQDEQFRVAGDTHFAFLTPEAAFEDVVVLQEMIARGFISRKTAVAMLMVDFPNPVFSIRRASLIAYVPEQLELAANSLEATFVARVRAADAAMNSVDSPERAFLEIFDLPAQNWEAEVSERLAKYLTAVARRLATPDGVEAFFRLAESRRRAFRRRPLSEFRLTTPTTNIAEDAPLLEMTVNADVQPKAE